MMEKGALLARGGNAEIFAWGNNGVLKLFHSGYLPEGVEYEVKVTAAVFKAGLPVPAVDGTVVVDDRPGIIFEKIEGPTLLDLLLASPWQVPEYARIMSELHTRVHSCEIPWLLPARQRLGGDILGLTNLPPAMGASALKILTELPDTDTLCHFDLHPINIIMSTRGPVIIDWEGARKGDRLADIARSWLLLRHSYLPLTGVRRLVVSAIRHVFCSRYLRGYRRHYAIDDKRLAAWKIPIATARLAEGVSGEETYLLKLLQRLLSSGS